MATNASMGGLFASVTLDIDDALRQLRRLQAELQRMQGTLTRAGAGGVGIGGIAPGQFDALVAGAHRASQAMAMYAASSDKVQRKNREQVASIQALQQAQNGHRREIRQAIQTYNEAGQAVKQWRDILATVRQQQTPEAIKRANQALKEQVGIAKQLADAQRREQAQAHQAELAEKRLARARQTMASFGLDPSRRRVREYEREAEKLDKLSAEVEQVAQRYRANDAVLKQHNAALAKQQQVVTGLAAAIKAEKGAQDALNATRNKALQTEKQLIAESIRLTQTLQKQGRVAASTASNIAAAMRPASAALQSISFIGGNRAFFAIGGVVRSVATAFQTAGRAAAGWAAAIGAAALVVAGFIAGLNLLYTSLRKVINIGIKHGTEIEKMAISYKTLLGSAEAARAEINFLQEQAITSPFMTESVLRLNRFLLAQGFVATEMRHQVVDATLDLGSALGLTGDQLEQVAYALGQVRSAGRLTGDEARQLTNNFINWQAVLRMLPEYANKTGLELKRLQEEGAISSEQFFTAYLKYTEQFSDASDAMAKSLQGVWDNLKDIFEFNLGEAFAGLDMGDMANRFAPVKLLADWLGDVQRILALIDWRPLAASVSLLFQGLFGRAARWVQTRGTDLVDFFEISLPDAIADTANFIRELMTFFTSLGTVVSAVWSAMVEVWNEAFSTVSNIYSQNIANTQTWANNVANLIAGLVTALQWFLLHVQLALAGIEAVRQGANLFPGSGVQIWDLPALAIKSATDREGSMQAIKDFFTDVPDEASEAGKAVANFWDLLQEAESFKPDPAMQDWATGIAETIAAIPAMEMPTFDDIDTSSLDDLAKDVDTFGNDMSSAADEAGDALDEFMRRLAQAMDTLFDLTRRWFGMRSELEVAFLGDKGFAGTVDSIAQMGKQLIEIFKDIGATSVSALIRGVTMELLDVARAQELLAGRLERAESRLEKAIEAQKELSRSVREAAIGYALALEVGEEAFEVLVSVSEKRGFFYAQQQSETKSFAEQLKERVKALREFARNVRELRKRGLDPKLLQEILTAGPEVGGEIARQLTEGGPAQIRQVNALSRQARKTAKNLGKYAGKEFKQAGVNTARALVAGLEAQMEKLEDTAKALTRVIYQAVLPFAKEANDLGQDIGGEMASGLGSMAPEMTEKSKDVGRAIAAPSALEIYRRSGEQAIDEQRIAWREWVRDENNFAPFDTLTAKVLRKIQDTKTAVEDEFTNWIIEVKGSVKIAGIMKSFYYQMMKAFEIYSKPPMSIMFPENKAIYDRFATEYYKWSQAAAAQPLTTPPPSGRNTGSTSGGGGGGGGMAMFSVESATPNVNVYIGDTELRGIVQTEVYTVDDANVQYLNAGRRI